MTALFQAPELDAKEVEVLGRIEGLKRRLRFLVGETPRRWQGLLRRTTFAKAIQGSNSIEGYHVTVEDAIAAAEGEQPREATGATWAAVTGYRSAMTYVLQLEDDEHFNYSTDLIRSLHFMMMQYDLTKNPGTWRPGAIYVRADERNEAVYEGPDAERVPALMQALAQSLQSNPEGPRMVQAAMGHLNLVMIHPFSDGNGRMARCLQTLILARSGTPAAIFSSIEEYLGRNTRAYCDVLATVGAGSWHPERDARPWVRFCLTAHYRQAMTLLRRSREYDKLWTLLGAEVSRLGLPERLILGLMDAALGFTIRNATYRPVAEISDQLASRDLRAGVDAGLLEAHGERRGRYYTGSPIVKAIRAKTAEPKGVPDPFEEPMLAAVPDNLMLPGLEEPAD